MLNARPIISELPFENALRLGIKAGWTGQELVEGYRGLMVYGQLHLEGHTSLQPAPIHASLRHHVLDGVLSDGVFHVTDLLVFHRQDIRRWPLLGRQRALKLLTLPKGVQQVASGRNIGEFLEAVVYRGGKGIVLKQLHEPYGQGTWVRVVRRFTESVVITQLHEETRSASIGQFAGEVLIDRGKVYLGAEFAKARLSQVIEISVQGQSPNGKFKGVDFRRFQHEKQALACQAW